MSQKQGIIKTKFLQLLTSTTYCCMQDRLGRLGAVVPRMLCIAAEATIRIGQLLGKRA